MANTGRTAAPGYETPVENTDDVPLQWDREIENYPAEGESWYTPPDRMPRNPGGTFLLPSGQPFVTPGGTGPGTPALAPPPSPLLSTQEKDPFGYSLEMALRNLVGEEGRINTLISGAKAGFDSALNAQMGRLLQDAGFRADTGRMGVGANFADRGLGRSTFAAQGVNEVSLKELDEKGDIRSSVQGAGEMVGDYIGEAQKTIGRRRTAIQNSQNMDELSAAEGIQFAIDKDAVMSDFQQRLSDLQMDAKEKAALAQLAGGFLEGLVQLFV